MSNLDDKLRFESKYRVIESDCWQWQDSLISNGYGYFYNADKKRYKAHRFAYQLYVGKIPSGLQLDHLCRNRGCVNPEHLEPVTSGENTRRGRNIWRERTECPRGHEYNEANTYISSKSHRFCRKCRVIANRKYKESLNHV